MNGSPARIRGGWALRPDELGHRFAAVALLREILSHGYIPGLEAGAFRAVLSGPDPEAGFAEVLLGGGARVRRNGDADP